MTLRNTESAFGSVAKWLHWGMALLIIASLALIELKDFAPKGSAARAALRDWHGEIRLVVLALVWFRLLWNPPTGSPRSFLRLPRGSVWPRTRSPGPSTR